MYLEIACFALPALGLAGMILKAIRNPLLDMLVFRDGGHGRRLTDLIELRQAQNVPWAGITGELKVKEVFARMRREASDAVEADPANWFAHLIKAKADAFENMKAIDPYLCGMLGQMVEGLDYGNILYPEATRLVDRQVMERFAPPTDDMRAALKIVK